MRYLTVLLLAGCTQTMLLYPRPGGTPLQGTLSTTASTMTVDVDGETYRGSFKRGRSVGIGFSGTKVATGIGASNQYAGLLVSDSGKTLRCEFVGGLAESGNGVCQHGDGRTYDLLLKP